MEPRFWKCDSCKTRALLTAKCKCGQYVNNKMREAYRWETGLAGAWDTDKQVAQYLWDKDVRW